MRTTAILLVLCLSFYCAFAKINLSYFVGTGCPADVQTKAACTIYASGTASLDIVEDDYADYNFETNDNKGIVNGSLTVSGRISDIFVTKDIQDGFINHVSPLPSSTGLRFSGQTGQIEKVNIRNGLNDTEFEYYEIAIVNYVTPNSGSLIVPSIVLTSLFSLASFFF